MGNIVMERYKKFFEGDTIRLEIPEYNYLKGENPSFGVYEIESTEVFNFLTYKIEEALKQIEHLTYELKYLDKSDSSFLDRKAKIKDAKKEISEIKKLQKKV